MINQDNAHLLRFKTFCNPGIYITFPGGRSWGHCVPIDVDKVGFDKLMKLDESSYSNGPEIVHSSNGDRVLAIRATPQGQHLLKCCGF